MTKITTVIKGVTITLTDDQVAQINKQSKSKEKYNHYTDIKTIDDAIEYLKSNKLLKGIEITLIEELWYGKVFKTDLPASIQLKLIARAINHLIDDTLFPNWNNENQYKHYPYHEITSPGELRFCDSFYSPDCHSYGVVAFTKTDESSNYLGTQFIKLYEQLLNEY